MFRIRRSQVSESHMPSSPSDGPSGGVSEADRESYAGDVSYNIAKDKLAADDDARMTVAKTGWFLATMLLVAFVAVLYAYTKSSISWSNARLPWIWTSPSGQPMLVSNAQIDKGWEGIPDVVVQSEVRRFLDMRYGCSSYHVRVLWNPLTTYWLTRAQTQDFLREMKPVFDDLQRESNWRRIQVRSIQFEKRTALEGGGTRYLAQIEYLASDLRAEEVEPRRQQLYKLKLDFGMGTPPGVTDPNKLVLWAQNNPLNFRVFESFRSDPVEISAGGATQQVGAATPTTGGVPGGSPGASTLPPPPAPTSQPSR